MSSNTNNVLESALSYANKGWPVIALFGIKDGVCTCSKGLNCDPNMRGKHPVTRGGKSDATTDIGTICSWLEQHPNRNIGIITGRSASGFFVLDMDPRNGGEASFAKLVEEYGPLPLTLTAKTGGGGRHYYFQHPKNQIVRTGNSFLGTGLDIKGDDKTGGSGGYVVAAPSLHASGNYYEWLDPNMPLAEPPEWLLTLVAVQEVEQSVTIDPTVERLNEVHEGNRHNYLVGRAGKLVQHGFAPDALLSALLAENYSKCKPPLPDDEVRRIASDLSKYEFKDYRFDDIGNGRRFSGQHASRVRHCWSQNRWYIWDGTRWAPDQLGQVYQFAKQTVSSMHEEVQTKQGNIAVAMEKWARHSGKAERVKAMIEMARSESKVSVRADELDAQRTFLNCPNGILDLDTGKLHPHSPKALLTKISTTNYNPNARSKEWEEFLYSTTQGDQELIEFLQRAAGYALSGLTTEEYVFFIYGPGGTGKTTYVEAIKGVLGEDYAKTASFATFLKTNNTSPNAPRSDIARLAGARLVTAIEMAKGRQLAEDLVKAATGGDKIVTRNLYSSEFEFIPQYKLWLASNDKPRIREDDSGLWRRLLLLPFYHVVPNPNKNLKDIFRFQPEHREAILAWCVRGFAKWRADGMRIPERVKEETKAYRMEMDPLNDWIENCTEPNLAAHTPFRQLWESYEEWINKQPPAVKYNKIGSTKAFGLALQEKGYERDVKMIGGKQQKVYKGLVLIF